MCPLFFTNQSEEGTMAAFAEDIRQANSIIKNKGISVRRADVHSYCRRVTPKKDVVCALGWGYSFRYCTTKKESIPSRIVVVVGLDI